jgi:transposase InsO family protein
MPLIASRHVNDTWSADFVMDALANSRRIKCLTVVDDFSRECVDIAIDYGMGGQYVTRVLDQVGQFRGYPKAIRTDQGPEFTSRAFMAWAHARGVRHLSTTQVSPRRTPTSRASTASSVYVLLAIGGTMSRAELCPAAAVDSPRNRASQAWT